MTKQAVIDTVHKSAEKAGIEITKKDAGAIVDAMFDTMVMKLLATFFNAGSAFAMALYSLNRSTAFFLLAAASPVRWFLYEMPR